MRFRISLLAIAVGIMALDQYTKALANKSLVLYQSVAVMPFWNWTLAYNEGAAFSFLANQGGWQKVFFASISVLVSIWIAVYLLRKTYTKLFGIALSFVLGGAVGNMIDRIFIGKVTDFIDWYVGTHHWPVFNIADSFVCIGVALLLIENIFFAKKDVK